MQPWTFCYGIVERGHCWDEIAAILNSLEEPSFKVTPRSVRDHYASLVKKYKEKRSREEKASGISPERSEIDDALQDLIERFSEADAERKKEIDDKKSKAEDDLIKAQEMRNMSLETFGESRKRKDSSESEEGQTKRSRKSSGDIVAYLKEKSQSGHDLPQQEIILKRDELAIQAQQLNNSQQLQNAQIQMMQQQNAAMIQLIHSLKTD